MTQEEIQKNKEAFTALCRKHIRREGLEALLDYLEGTDFYTAPSSTAYHLNEDGGLCLHSMNVFRTAMRIYDGIAREAMADGTGPFEGEIPEESIAISALFHDLCKVKLYRKAERWKKDEAGRWVSYPGYEVSDEFPLGHGEKSCLIVSWYMKLRRDELLAIRWHMGMFDLAPQGMSQSYSFRNALDQCPLASIIHAADFIASNLLEKTTQYK
ncbi:MAG: HD domain-containing protein [Alloprevotella sp.]|nr:HD domain-containing protein [Alloprevotella sp.]